MPPGPGPELLVNIGSVPVDAADSLGKAGQGVDQRSATSVLPVWLRGICGLAIDGVQADGQRDKGEEGVHNDDPLSLGKLENVIENKLHFNELFFFKFSSFLCFCD